MTIYIIKSTHYEMSDYRIGGIDELWSYVEEYYFTDKAKAEKECARLNEAEVASDLKRENEKIDAGNDRLKRDFLEEKALYDAGLRENEPKEPKFKEHLTAKDVGRNPNGWDEYTVEELHLYEDD